MMQVFPHKIAFKHEINGLKDRGDKNHVDENVSEHGILPGSIDIEIFFQSVKIIELYDAGTL